MPANTISADLNCNTSNGNTIGVGGLEDQRALQLALELTMLGLNPADQDIQDCADYNNDMNDDMMKKRSQNMTECVPVPSSEHVAEIVGRQGCKIKALRAKTNTYIKTPVRGEEPVFVVTGRKEDVTDAKREILSAADHFSQIRASRRNNNSNLTLNGLSPPSPNGTSTPGQVTLQVRVPYRVVGLVVGPKGATIKRIQQLSHTYIVTPSRDKEPVFEVTGKAEHVETARIEIEKHIAMRTGGGNTMMENGGSTPDDIENNGYEIVHDQLNNEQMSGTNLSSTMTSYNVFNAALNNQLNGNLLANTTRSRQNGMILPDYPNINGPPKRTDAFDMNGMNGFQQYNEYSYMNGYRRPDEDTIMSTPAGYLSNSVWQDNLHNQQRMSMFGKGVIGSQGQQQQQQQHEQHHQHERSNSLDGSPNLSPNSDQHATIRRISSDPVNPSYTNVTTSESSSTGWPFQPLEFSAIHSNLMPTVSSSSPSSLSPPLLQDS